MNREAARAEHLLVEVDRDTDAALDKLTSSAHHAERRDRTAVRLVSLSAPDLPIGKAAGSRSRHAYGRTESGLARPHTFRLDRGDRGRAGRRADRLGPAVRPVAKPPPYRAFCPCGSHDGRPAVLVATRRTALMEPVTTASSPNKFHRALPHQAVGHGWAILGPPLSLATRPVGQPHYRSAGGMLFRAKAVAFRSPRQGDTSIMVGGTRSCRAAWSARHPVKVEVAGSNPVRTAGISGEASLGSQPGQVAQLV